jgi:hypothetical protein
MNLSPQVVHRLNDLVRRHNREIAFQAALKGSLGIAFTLVTYGFIFWFGWFVGCLIASYLGLTAWQFGVILTSLFFVAATWSAWRRVDPLAGLKPLSDAQWSLMLLGPTLTGTIYFRPRHATAGAAVVLIGGPASVMTAFGIWTHRLRIAGFSLDDAAQLLAACRTAFPADQVREPRTALLLMHLHLIKVVPSGDSVGLVVTDRGFAVLEGAKKRRKRDTGHRKGGMDE